MWTFLEKRRNSENCILISGYNWYFEIQYQYLLIFIFQLCIINMFNFFNIEMFYKTFKDDHSNIRGKFKLRWIHITYFLIYNALFIIKYGYRNFPIYATLCFSLTIFMISQKCTLTDTKVNFHPPTSCPLEMKGIFWLILSQLKDNVNFVFYGCIERGKDTLTPMSVRQSNFYI